MNWEKWVIPVIVAVVLVLGFCFFSFLHIANKRNKNFINLSKIITDIESNYHLIPTTKIQDMNFGIKVFDKSLDLYIEKSAYIQKRRINHSLMLFDAYLDSNRKQNQEIKTSDGQMHIDHQQKVIELIVPGSPNQSFKIEDLFYLKTVYDFKTKALIFEIVCYNNTQSVKFQLLTEPDLWAFNQLIFDLINQK
ncbi:hypothetical protein ELUMI_v1c07910 [Williamsoniiplasma luminosum]|uniref:Uncharacterized protein n=1 Tax=Williamsoniiplasma luminosum TaxID=214888 RepID=A0A2K8NXZ1_9MOLU|nr:hypothetical protein [Williamsoniiplasma luminosum]ATZ17513.1 hypothetical protein ELUMI_v1c07910 [Williamsoniiplasma luminosum]